MEPWVVATSLIFIYLIATIILGVIANKRMTVDMEDFFLYGRKAGFIVLYLTVVATFHWRIGLPAPQKTVLVVEERHISYQ